MAISQLLHDTLLAWLMNNPLLSAIIPPAVTADTDTFSFDETSALEQTVFTVVVADRVSVGSILLDMSNVTQDTTISLYIQIDGVNYVKVQENNWTTLDDDGVMIDGFVTPHNFRVTFTCGGAGAGSVDVVWAVQ